MDFRKSGTLVVVGLLIGALLPLAAGASSYNYVTGGMRPRAMGNAFTGVADDVNAVLFNPAGTSWTDVYEFTLMHNKKYNLTIGPDYSTSFVGFSTPGYRFGSFGFAYQKSGDDSILSEESLLFSYGKSFNDVISAGVSYKRLSLKPRGWQQQAGDPAIADQGTSAFDMSLLGRFKGVTCGLALRNLGGEVGIVEKEKLPSMASLGLSFKVADTLLCALDLDSIRDIKETSGRSMAYHVGLEYVWRDTMSLRAGANDGKPTFGVGLKARNIKLDLAYTEKGVTKDKFQFSAGMFFGRGGEISGITEPEKAETTALTKVIRALPETTEKKLGELVLKGRKVPMTMVMERDGIRYVPGGLVADYLEMSLFYNAESGEGMLQAGEETFKFQTGSNLVVVGDQWRRMSGDLVEKDKTPWLPLDSVAKVFEKMVVTAQ